MARPSKTIIWGLWLLRFGLGIFLLLWSIDKMVSPISTVEIFAAQYFIDLSPSIVMIMGSLELTLSLLIMLGMYRTITYGAGLVIQIVSVAAHYPQLLDPFGKNHLFIAELSILFGFTALFVMRNFDTQWALAKRNNIFARH
jgi:putative oxidoreductase